MKHFRFICPECYAVVIAASSDGLMWERCPACRHHIWDQYDALMADAIIPENASYKGCYIHAIN